MLASSHQYLIADWHQDFSEKEVEQTGLPGKPRPIRADIFERNGCSWPSLGRSDTGSSGDFTELELGLRLNPMHDFPSNPAPNCTVTGSATTLGDLDSDVDDIFAFVQNLGSFGQSIVVCIWSGNKPLRAGHQCYGRID